MSSYDEMSSPNPPKGPSGSIQKRTKNDTNKTSISVKTIRKPRGKNHEQSLPDSSDPSDEATKTTTKSMYRKNKRISSKIDINRVYRALELIDYKIKRKDVDYTNQESNLAKDFEKLLHDTEISYKPFHFYGNMVNNELKE